MQKEEEDYAVTNTEAGEIFMSNAGNSSSPINPKHTYHDMVDYMLNDPPSTSEPRNNNTILSRTGGYRIHQPMRSMECGNNGGVSTIDNIDSTVSFADVMQFAEYGSKLTLNHNQQGFFQQQQQHDVNANLVDHKIRDHTLTEIEDDTSVYFLKFPVLNTTIIHDDDLSRDGGFGDPLQEVEGRDHFRNPLQLEFISNNAFDINNTHNNNDNDNDNDNLPGLAKSLSEKTGNDDNMEGVVVGAIAASSKKKRARTIKTNEQVESQRMTHIAVERNRRKQMNEHLRVLRSLMPSSYVQRGDQASIIGGAIEFVRELEQLLQCLESQKRRRLYGDQVQAAARPISDSSNSSSSSTVLGLTRSQLMDMDLTSMPTPTLGGSMHEETAESKSCVAHIQVKVLGFDALIKILSPRRPTQLIKAIAALEDLNFTILHTNITTIEQTVLYSFNVKVASEGRFTAEDIADSVQQIFTFIHANTSII